MERVGVVSLLAMCSILILNYLDFACANSEGDALYAFKSGLDQRFTDNLASWDSNLINPCTWFHVTCNAADSVTSVDLGIAGLVGELHLDLTKLPNLTRLTLHENFLYGDLTNLNLSSNLANLDIGSNALEGPIPPVLLNLPLLERLDLSSCSFNGTLPEYTNQQPNLKTINISDNALSGSVPASWDIFIPTARIVDLTHNFGRTNGVSYLTGNCTPKPCYNY